MVSLGGELEGSMAAPAATAPLAWRADVFGAAAPGHTTAEPQTACRAVPRGRARSGSRLQRPGGSFGGHLREAGPRGRANQRFRQRPPCEDAARAPSAEARESPARVVRDSAGTQALSGEELQRAKEAARNALQRALLGEGSPLEAALAGGFVQGFVEHAIDNLADESLARDVAWDHDLARKEDENQETVCDVSEGKAPGGAATKREQEEAALASGFVRGLVQHALDDLADESLVREVAWDDDLAREDENQEIADDVSEGEEDVLSMTSDDLWEEQDRADDAQRYVQAALCAAKALAQDEGDETPAEDEEEGAQELVEECALPAVEEVAFDYVCGLLDEGISGCLKGTRAHPEAVQASPAPQQLPPVAALTPPCASQVFTRTLCPQRQPAPVSEEPFPLDCLPSAPVQVVAPPPKVDWHALRAADPTGAAPPVGAAPPGVAAPQTPLKPSSSKGAVRPSRRAAAPAAASAEKKDWPAPRPAAPAAAFLAAKSGEEPSASTAWQAEPSVGTWYQPKKKYPLLEKLKESAQRLATQDATQATAHVAAKSGDEPGTSAAWQTEPSVGTWYQPTKKYPLLERAARESAQDVGAPASPQVPVASMSLSPKTPTALSSVKRSKRRIIGSVSKIGPIDAEKAHAEETAERALASTSFVVPPATGHHRPASHAGSPASSLRHARRAMAAAQRDPCTFFRMNTDDAPAEGPALARKPSIGAMYDALGAEFHSLHDKDLWTAPMGEWKPAFRPAAGLAPLAGGTPKPTAQVRGKSAMALDLGFGDDQRAASRCSARSTSIGDLRVSKSKGAAVLLPTLAAKPGRGEPLEWGMGPSRPARMWGSSSVPLF